jgi:hypothetical protein
MSHTPFEIAKVFLARGTPFSTRIPLRIPKSASHNCSVSMLGWRKKGYQPDRLDYMEYEEQLKAFLHGRPHARAALLKGGLIWRLAKEVLGNSMDEYSLAGPSQSVVEFGDSFPVEAGGQELADDTLSEQELDFICGLYKVYTGKFC